LTEVIENALEIHNSLHDVQNLAFKMKFLEKVNILTFFSLLQYSFTWCESKHINVLEVSSLQPLRKA